MDDVVCSCVSVKKKNNNNRCKNCLYSQDVRTITTVHKSYVNNY